VETHALVVRSVAYGESDVIATLLTEQEGKIAAIVRGARKGSRRVAGALEPLHTITATYEDKGSELVTMKEARVIKPRTNLLRHLESMEAAGTMLRWARHVFPPRTPEPAAFATLIETLDALDGSAAGGTSGTPDDGSAAGGISQPITPMVELARAGLRLLADIGWGIELERCVQCGARCPEDASAQIDAQKGGIVCRKCGGARVLLRAPARRAAIVALSKPSDASTEPHARALIELVESVMAAHTGYT
jgi:DNA repair protein RecO (recombination protein O)